MHWLDGKPCERIPLNNRAMLYGDGLFETIAVVGRKAPFWSWHWQRLQQGCRRLQLAAPSSDLLLDEIQRLADDDQPCIMRLCLFRQTPQQRGYHPHGVSACQRWLSRYPWPPGRGQPLTVGVSSITLARQPLLAGIKHLNRLEQVLAAGECETQGWDEAVMSDTHQQLVCGVMGNLIIRLDDRWLTPPVDQCGIAGVTRQWLLERGPQAIEIMPLAMNNLEQIDELWLCNAAKGMRPAATLAGRQLAVSAAGQTMARAIDEHLGLPCAG
ncbi:MAG: aminodeoxychorismate lyase [Wenzhouxiangellaceae bacterium]